MQGALQAASAPPTPVFAPPAPGMEPTKEEMGGLMDAAKIFAWIPMRDPELSAVFTELGIHPDDPPRIIAMLNDDLIYDKIQSMPDVPPTRWAKVAVGVEVARNRVGLLPTVASMKAEA